MGLINRLKRTAPLQLPQDQLGLLQRIRCIPAKLVVRPSLLFGIGRSAGTILDPHLDVHIIGQVVIELTVVIELNAAVLDFGLGPIEIRQCDRATDPQDMNKPSHRSIKCRHGFSGIWARHTARLCQSEPSISSAPAGRPAGLDYACSFSPSRR